MAVPLSSLAALIFATVQVGLASEARSTRRTLAKLEGRTPNAEREALPDAIITGDVANA